MDGPLSCSMSEIMRRLHLMWQKSRITEGYHEFAWLSWQILLPNSDESCIYILIIQSWFVENSWHFLLHIYLYFKTSDQLDKKKTQSALFFVHIIIHFITQSHGAGKNICGNWNFHQIWGVLVQYAIFYGCSEAILWQKFKWIN